jgi:hypothetical protein
MNSAPRSHRAWRLAVLVGALAALVMALTAGAIQAGPSPKAKGPKFSEAKAFDVSKPLKDLAKTKPSSAKPVTGPPGSDRGPVVEGGTSASYRTSAMQARSARTAVATISSPMANFEGLSNQDNFNVFGFRVNPPDSMGDVGPNHYVEMINLVLGVYDKQGNKLLGPVAIGSLWDGFAVEDCTDPSGDPVVLYDQFVDRWILTQFTTRGLDSPYTEPFYDCVAISTTSDPTGSYYRYAFKTQPDEVDGGYFFPDYPKYGVWTDSYVLTTRDFGFATRYGISVYALEKNKMVNGDPKARAVQFFLEEGDVPLETIGDGLLPADVDGKQKPPPNSPIPIIGTQDDGAGYGATFDALNVWELSVKWKASPEASLELADQLPTAAFDSIFPCAPTSRDCLPQPGITNPAQFLDVLSYRQRPTWRLAYRNFKGYESLVTNQTVEAAPGVAGIRWYEIRRADGKTVYPAGGPNYSIYQQGTYAPGDGVHRWMGSIAQDKYGNAAVGYSVVNGVDVYPGIRYTGRLADDPLGQMALGEGTIVSGTGVQTTTNSRWGDYSSMNVDPVDDCTFWYVNEYYTAASQATSPAGWLTRIASFKLPGCS